MARIRLLVAEGQPMLRTGLRTVLGAEPDLEVVGEAGDGREVIRLARSLRPDVVLMSPLLPKRDGALTTRDLVAVGSPVRVLLLAGDTADPLAAQALRAGAHGLIPAGVPPAALVSAIRAVAEGSIVLEPAVFGRLLDPTPPSNKEPSLTEREWQVLGQMARGWSNAEIATRLGVSETTVKTHVGHVLAKLGLRDRVQAVVFAYESGLIRAVGAVPYGVRGEH